MRHNLKQLLFLATAILLPIQVGYSVLAANAPVKFSVPGTTLTIKGFASPGAFVQIIDGDSLIGTVLADENGVFIKDFTSMSSGLHSLRLSYDDDDGIASDTITQNINIRAQSDTAVEYFLPPTLLARPASLVEGEFATFSGSSIPNANVEIILDGGNLILRPQTDSNGRFTISVDTTGYYFGEHNIAASVSQGGLTSFQTLKKPFIIVPIESGVGDDLQAGRGLDPPIITAPEGEIESSDVPTLIRGTAPPNTQIIIYLDGEPIGSTFAGPDGRWFFNIYATKTTHDIRSIACVGNNCSDFSNLAQLNFIGDFGRCSSHLFLLDNYRFWGVNQGRGTDISVTDISGTPSYEVLIDWGDNVSERFNRNTSQSFSVHHVYREIGQFNGQITIVDGNDCEFSRYFSVDVDEAGFNMIWLLLIVPGVLAGVIHSRRRFITHRKQLILAR